MYTPGTVPWVWLHVISGALALAFGLAAMLLRKGSRRHVLAGRLYLGAVAFVLISTVPILPLVAERQQAWVAEYLISIDVLVAYLAVSGARRPRRVVRVWPDIVIACAGALIGIGFLIESIQDAYLMRMLMDSLNTPISLDTQTASFFLAVFGIGILLMVWEDIYLIRHAELRPGRYLSTHLGRMAGSYLGLVTAVVVVNLSKPVTNLGVPQWILWLTPALIGAMIITVNVQRVGRLTRFPQG
jgi:uncharacterized membrane protein